MSLVVQRELHWINQRVAWLLEKGQPMQPSINQAIEEQMEHEEHDPRFRRRLGFHSSNRYG